MADFPASQLYSQPRPAACPGSACVIVNGRRVSVGSGATGSELAARVGGPGRRAVILSGTQARPLEDGRFYTPAELKDSRGMPVRISSIPDRTKGGEPWGGERVLVFLDFANVNAGARAFGRLDYSSLLGYLAAGRFLVEAYAYVPIDPRNPDGRRGLVRHLQAGGWMVTTKMGKIAGDSYKSNVDVEMSIDMMRSAQQIRPDIMVLCSGDGDFLPVVREMRRMGVRAEVASFEQSADASLRYEASGFISLDVWQDEVRSREAEERELPAQGAPENLSEPFPDAFGNEAPEAGDTVELEVIAPAEARPAGRPPIRPFSCSGVPMPPRP